MCLLGSNIFVMENFKLEARTKFDMKLGTLPKLLKDNTELKKLSSIEIKTNEGIVENGSRKLI